jgi:predicted acylesterase/phospholipase RssA
MEKKTEYSKNVLECIEDDTEYQEPIITTTQGTATQEKDHKIRYLVLSGGCHYGLTFYGLLRESNKVGFWNLNNIRGIYGTSVGSLLAVIICLNYNWNVLDNYFVNRPWNNLFRVNFSSILLSYQKKGLFDRNIFVELFRPLFNGIEPPIPLDITMKDFFTRTRIDLHIFTTEINGFCTVDISHSTHPELPLIDVVYQSCCIPILFSPIIGKEQCYIDGSTIQNYPIDVCVNSVINTDEIMGVKLVQKSCLQKMGENVSFFDYLLTVFHKLFVQNSARKSNAKIKHEFVVEIEMFSLYEIADIISSIPLREQMIQRGADIFNYSFVNPPRMEDV